MQARVLLAVFSFAALVLIFRDCETQEAVSSESEGTEERSSFERVEMTFAPPNSAFDPRDFLCSFTGGPAGESHDMMAGRRYTPAERARARAQIAGELRRIRGLSFYEHNYEWADSDSLWMSREYVEMNNGRGTNLIAGLCATRETDEWIMVGAHYDSADTTPGADDNASGVTATIMVAQRLARLPVRNRNVMFVFFDQEEEGLIGSHALARTLVSESWDVRAAHVIDMIGWDNDDDRVVELAHCGMPVAPQDTMMQLYRRAAGRINSRAGEARIGDVLRRESCRSDHVYLTQYGIPSVQSCEEFSGDDVTPYYHRRGDTCDTLDYVFITAVADLVAEAVTLQLQ